MELKADLHVHTCLSPCAEAEMVPTAIVAAAKARGLDILGICDHNSAENVAAVKACAEPHALLVLGGMEITSVEEVHVLSFFEHASALQEAQTIMLDSILERNDEAVFGYQWIVDSDDSVIGRNNKRLIGATPFTVDEIVAHIHRLGGLAVAAHIDREAFSLLGQLGFIPPRLGLDGLEVSARYRAQPEFDAHRFGLPLIRSSDAHMLADIGSVHTTFHVESASYGEIAAAMRAENGRSVRI